MHHIDTDLGIALPCNSSITISLATEYDGARLVGQLPECSDICFNLWISAVKILAWDLNRGSSAQKAGASMT